MPTEERGFHHAVIGPIHEVTVTRNSAAGLRRALEHERDDCQAMRVMIDLTAVDDLHDDEVEVLVDLVDRDDERWMIRLEGDAPLVGRLSDAGFEGQLLGDSHSPDAPHHVGRDDHPSS